jgi:ABC-2 type transport system permease protein
MTCTYVSRGRPSPCETARRRKGGAITAISAASADADARRLGDTPPKTAAFLTLVRRRLALSARTPREVLVPLIAPVLFAIVIAPAFDAIGPKVPGVDYTSYVAVSMAGLLIPYTCMFAGISVIVDRQSGAQPDVLAAPISRSLIVAGNLAVAVLIAALQVVVLITAAVLRGAELHTSLAGVAWFASSAGFLAIAMYSVAETLANKIPTLEEYTGTIPPVGIVPFFFAGSIFPITALPGWLTAVARFLPLTHAVALMRYGLLNNANGLRDIWGMTDPITMAALSLVVVGSFAAVLVVVAVRVFIRSAVR